MPSDLAGKYKIYLGFDAAASEIARVGLTTQICVNYGGSSAANRQQWVVASIGASLGVSLTPLASFNVRTSGLNEGMQKVINNLGYVGEIKTFNSPESILLTKAKKTGKRSIWDISVAWIRFSSPQGIMSEYGKVILDLVRAALKTITEW